MYFLNPKCYFLSYKFYSICILNVLVIFPVNAYSKNILPVFPDATIEYQIESNAGKNQIILSSPKRINNALFIEKQKFVLGDKLSSLFLINNSNVKNAYKFYLGFFQQHGEILYQCEKRACGSSNYWADTLFKEHRLYGRDNGQYYIAGKVELDGQINWVSIYIVKNGLRESLVFTTIITEHIKNYKWQNGLLIDSETLTRNLPFIQKELRDNQTLKLWLVAYGSNTNISTVSGMTKKLKNEALKVQTTLIKSLDIKPERIQIKIVGPFHSEKKPGDSVKWFRLFLLEQ